MASAPPAPAVSTRMRDSSRPSVTAPGPPAAPRATTFISRHPVLTFYALAFTISWVGILLVIGGPANFPGTSAQVNQLFVMVMFAWLAGPSLASVVMTGLVSGRAGYRELFARLARWKVSARWYAVALLAAPLVYVGLSLVLSLVSADFVSGILVTTDRTSLLLMGLAYGLVGGGFLEELGWTGFVVPRLRRDYGIFGTAIIAGVLWGAYHFSVIYWATSPAPSGTLGRGSCSRNCSPGYQPTGC